MRVRISTALRTAVWNRYIGESFGTSKCYTGCGTSISQATFQCGHVIPASKSGPTDVNNLRPVCQRCNTSMGAKNMFDFMHECGFTIDSPTSYLGSKGESYPNIKKLISLYGVGATQK